MRPFLNRTTIIIIFGINFNMRFGTPCSPGTNIQMHYCLQINQRLLSYLTISNSTTAMPTQAKRNKGRRRFLFVQPFREEHEGCFNIIGFDCAWTSPKCTYHIPRDLLGCLQFDILASAGPCRTFTLQYKP